MQDWEDLEFFTIDEIKQSRRGKIKVVIVIAIIAIIFFGGATWATIAYGWVGLFLWLFFSGIVLVGAIGANNVRYK